MGSQGDLGTKWAPRFVRLTAQLPVTATNKVLKRVLRAERWQVDDPVWWRPEPGAPYRELSEADRRALNEAVADRVL